jgi:endonuclease YncB( thermonuclease family)
MIAIALAVVISGSAVIVDGDTIRIGDERIRLHGIDTPERKQRYFSDATEALRDRIGGREVRCEGIERDRYKRLVAKCYAGGEDLSRYMVQSGWASAYRKYSVDYVGDETKACAAGLGRWQTEAC